jgi:hypothetical protein
MSSKNVQNEQSTLQRPARHWSISRRLITLYAAASLLMLVVAAAYLHWSLVANVSRDDNAFLANKIQECRRLLREHPRDDRPPGTFNRQRRSAECCSKVMLQNISSLLSQPQLLCLHLLRRSF